MHYVRATKEAIFLAEVAVLVLCIGRLAQRLQWEICATLLNMVAWKHAKLETVCRYPLCYIWSERFPFTQFENDHSIFAVTCCWQLVRVQPDGVSDLLSFSGGRFVRRCFAGQVVCCTGFVKQPCKFLRPVMKSTGYQVDVLKHNEPPSHTTFAWLF